MEGSNSLARGAIKRRPPALSNGIGHWPDDPHETVRERLGDRNNPVARDLARRGEALSNAHEYVGDIQILPNSTTKNCRFYSVRIFCVAFILYFSLRTLGSTKLAELLYIDYSVEVVPYGQHDIAHLDWKELGELSGKLRHSEVYTSAVALQKLSDCAVLRQGIAGRLSGREFSGSRMTASGAKRKFKLAITNHTSRDCSTAAAIKLANSGCGSKGRDLSSG